MLMGSIIVRQADPQPIARHMVVISGLTDPMRGSIIRTFNIGLLRLPVWGQHAATQNNHERHCEPAKLAYRISNPHAYYAFSPF
jgi:hypothetical protein